MVMFFTSEKIHARVSELQAYRYQNRRAITNWKMSLDDLHGELKYPAMDANYVDVAPGYKWKELNAVSYTHLTLPTKA